MDVNVNFNALEINKYIYIYIYILYRNVCILYTQYIHTLQVRMSTSGIDTHYIG